ncbi:MAG: proteic killer suppression protein [Alteromonadaceae bacterium]|jgi:proteic killer suppression protein
MWEIYEHKKVQKQLKQLPADVLKHYEKFKDIIYLSGPQGLKLIRGFGDEALKGEWQGCRAARLNIQYRVIYKVVNDQVFIQVMNITPHDYRRK